MNSKVTPEQSDEIIKTQEDRLERVRNEIKFDDNRLYKYLAERGLSNNDFRSIVRDPKTADEAVDLMEFLCKDKERLLPQDNALRFIIHAQQDYNLARQILGLPHIDFTQSSYKDVARTAGMKISPSPKLSEPEK